MSPQKSLQCGQSPTQDGMLSYSMAVIIAVMAIRNIKLTIPSHISHDSLSMLIKMSEYAAEWNNLSISIDFDAINWYETLVTLA